MNQYAEDCIHLRACRRLCVIGKVNNRYCKSETCTAYESKSKYITREAANYAVRQAALDGEEGYTDVLIRDYV